MLKWFQSGAQTARFCMICCVGPIFQRGGFQFVRLLLSQFEVWLSFASHCFENVGAMGFVYFGPFS